MNSTTETAAPRRRWTFSLRTLLVVVTLLAILLGWVGYSLNWIRERHRFLDFGFPGQWSTSPGAKPPLLLRPFGERGVVHVIAVERDTFKAAKGLFPEAKVNRGIPIHGSLRFKILE